MERDPRLETTRIERREQSALTERTRVVMPLGVVMGTVIAIAAGMGAWMWRMQEQIGDLRTDVAVIRATVSPPSATTGAGGRVASNPPHAAQGE